MDSNTNIKFRVAMACKLMPYYRLGIFQKLTSLRGDSEFVFFGDTKEQGGIKQIPFSFANETQGKNIRWVKTNNYFYKPERLLWQTGIIKEIFGSNFKVFVFEGAIAHYPIWLFALLCQIFNKKVLFWTHGNRGLDKGIKKSLRIVLFKWLGDGLLLYGNTQRDIMIKDGYDPDKLFVVYNSLQAEKQFKTLKGLNDTLIKEKKSKLFEFPEGFTMIFIGRLVKSKGVKDILEVIENLKELNLKVNCIFIGDGPEKNDMIKECSKRGMDKQVHFAGQLYSESAIAPFFAMSDMMISPKNVGLNCIHSMAYGVPVITHGNFKFQNPEVEAIVENKTGVFFRYYDLENLTHVLKTWIQGKRDRNSIKQECQNMIKNVYSPENQANCISKAIKKIVHDR